MQLFIPCQSADLGCELAGEGHSYLLTLAVAFTAANHRKASTSARCALKMGVLSILNFSWMTGPKVTKLSQGNNLIDAFSLLTGSF